jgi:predicted transcriptional regulator of viral defense system
LYYVKILNKDKQYLAKALLKLYLEESPEEIKKYLAKYNSKVNFKRVKYIFDEYKIKEMKFDINLREDFVEHFIEKIYLNLDKSIRTKFLDNFILKIDKKDIDFSDMSKVVLKIISNYAS